MLRFGFLVASVGAVTLRVALRTKSFAVFTLLAILAVAAGTLPVSPGITAGESHYIKAGASTLLLGGIVLCIVLLPRVLPAGRGRFREEALLSLPLEPEVLTLGGLLGFTGALGCYFAAAGGAFACVALTSCKAADPANLALSAGLSLLLGMITAALVTALSALLAPLPALAAAVLFILGGQATAVWPAPLAVLLPPFDGLDPTMAAVGTPVGAGALLRGVASLGLYIFAALGIQVLRHRSPRASLSL